MKYGARKRIPEGDPQENLDLHVTACSNARRLTRLCELLGIGELEGPGSIPDLEHDHHDPQHLYNHPNPPYVWDLGEDHA